MDAGIDVSIGGHSPILDTNIPLKEKLYGYHRLDNPPVVYLNKGELVVGKFSDIMKEEKPSGISGREDIGPPEPEIY